MALSIACVVMDAAGTVIRPEPSAVDVYWATGRRFGSRLDRGTIASRFPIAVRRQFGPQREPSSGDVARGDEDAEDRRRWQRVVAETIDDVAERLPALFEALWGHFADPAHWAVFDDVPAAVDRVRAAGLRLAMASNFDRRLEAIVAGIPQLAAFDPVVCSSRLSACKPEPAFFDGVAQAIGLSADRLLMVGDDPDNDVRGALAAGWHAVWIDREASGRGDVNRITRLDEVLEFV